jgi:hypothetical protein
MLPNLARSGGIWLGNKEWFRNNLPDSGEIQQILANFDIEM